MKFTEIDVFGVYVAPISLMMIGAWLFLVLLRRAAINLGILRFVWHPALFMFSLYMIMLSVMVLVAAR
jgi:protein AaeX